MNYTYTDVNEIIWYPNQSSSDLVIYRSESNRITSACQAILRRSYDHVAMNLTRPPSNCLSCSLTIKRRGGRFLPPRQNRFRDQPKCSVGGFLRRQSGSYLDNFPAIICRTRLPSARPLTLGMISFIALPRSAGVFAPISNSVARTISCNSSSESC